MLLLAIGSEMQCLTPIDILLKKKSKCNSPRGTLHFGVRVTTEPPEDSFKIQGERKTISNVWKLSYTTIKVQSLKPLLENYPNIEVIIELLQGFQFDFRLGYKGPRLGGDSKKIRISLFQFKFPDAAEEKIISEVKMGRIAGPFSNKPISNLKISPIGIVTKSESSWRLVIHLSYPENNSVNHFKDPYDCTVAYTSLYQVLQEIAR